MFVIEFDRRRLRSDVKTLALQCRELKRVLRVRWEQPMAEQQRQQVRLRYRVTEMHVLLAWSRGRRHLAASHPIEAQALEAMLKRVALDYPPSPRLEQHP